VQSLSATVLGFSKFFEQWIFQSTPNDVVDRKTQIPAKSVNEGRVFVTHIIPNLIALGSVSARGTGRALTYQNPAPILVRVKATQAAASTGLSNRQKRSAKKPTQPNDQLRPSILWSAYKTAPKIGKNIGNNRHKKHLCITHWAQFMRYRRTKSQIHEIYIGVDYVYL